MGKDGKERINTERAESTEVTEKKAQHNCLTNRARRRLKGARGLSQGESRDSAYRADRRRNQWLLQPSPSRRLRAKAFCWSCRSRGMCLRRLILPMTTS